MFKFLASRNGTTCDGSTRRDFLKVGALGLGGLMLPNFPPADNGQAPIKPGLGSILARHRGANNARTGLPTYVRMSGILGDGPAWLGSSYAPFDTGGNARGNMNLKVTLDNLAERRSLL